MVVIPAPYHLKDQIVFFWYAETQADDNGIRRVKMIPDGKHGLIFQHREGRSTLSEENGNMLPVGFVYGQSSIPFVNYIHDAVSVFGVFFKAHAVKDIFRIDADKISDGFVDLDNLAGFNINEVLLNLPDSRAIYDYLSAFFWKKLNSYGKSDKLIEDSIFNIQKNISDVSTIQLYKEYNISKRQFQRRFKERAGIQPGMYIRVFKFQKSLQLLDQNNYEKLSDIAYTLGYADQSHFIREFKFFTGYTPKDLVNQVIIIPENAFSSNPLIQTRRHIYF